MDVPTPLLKQAVEEAIMPVPVTVPGIDRIHTLVGTAILYIRGDDLYAAVEFLDTDPGKTALRVVDRAQFYVSGLLDCEEDGTIRRFILQTVEFLLGRPPSE